MGSSLSLVKKDEIVEWYLKGSKDGYNLHGRLSKDKQKEEQDLEEILEKDALLGNIGGSRCKSNCFYFKNVEELESGEVIFTFDNGHIINYSRAYQGFGFIISDAIEMINLAIVQLSDPKSRIILNKIKAKYEQEQEQKRIDRREREREEREEEYIEEYIEDEPRIDLGGISVKFGGGSIENPETGRMVSINGRKGKKVIEKFGGLCCF